MITIDPRTTMGAVHLRVSDLDRAIAFYETNLGLVVQERADDVASLGAGSTRLLALIRTTGPRKARGTTGLYHFALLVPTRADLAGVLRRLVRTSTRMHGFADHGVSEALYLADPDRNGIEVYRDRARAEWPRVGGELQMVVDPLDVDDLLSDPAASESEPMPLGTVMGHVHLHVADLVSAHEFYVRVLGFEVTQRFGPGALFVSAGGYHHHLGLNTWAGVGAPPPMADAVGLRHYTIVLPDAAALDRVLGRVTDAGLPIESTPDGSLVRDPAENGILLTTA